MDRLSAGLGGRGTKMSMEPAPHPASHYEVKEMRVKKAKSGGFVVEHHMGLKKRHEAKPGFQTGYDARNPEPETHTASNMGELQAHMAKHFGGMKAKAAEAEQEDEGNEEDDEAAGDEEE